MEWRKWTFHFYSLKWHKSNKKRNKFLWIYKYNENEINQLVKVLKNASFFPNDFDDHRYKIHKPKYLKQNWWIIYWYFVHYYNEHIKTIENPKWEHHTSSEWYLFFYYINDNRIIFQHKKWIWDRPSIDDVKKRFISYYMSLLNNNGLAAPIDWSKDELWYERNEFMDVFFNKKNKITFLEVENFNNLNLIRQKNINGPTKFSYFNPIFDETDTAIQTERHEIENMKSIKAEALEWKTLWKIPSCRIAMAAWEKIKKMKFLDKWVWNEIVYVEKWTNSITEEIDSDTEISSILIENIIKQINIFSRGKKAKSNWESFNNNTNSLF